MPRSLLLRNAFRTLTVRSRPLVLCRESQVRTLSRTSSDNTPRVPPRLPGQNVDITPFSTGGSGRPSESWNQESNATMDQSQNDAALSQLQMIAYGLNPLDPASEGHKYGLPDLPLPSETTLKNRYDPVVVQVTKLIMRDGKLSKAQRVRTDFFFFSPFFPSSFLPSFYTWLINRFDLCSFIFLIGVHVLT